MASQNGGATFQPPDELPRDAKLMSLLLHSMNAPPASQSVLVQLLDLTHRYTSEVLQDAQLYSDHRGAGGPIPGATGACKVSLEDVRLAIEGKALSSFTTPPDRGFFAELANQKNSIPLPIISEKYGVRIPEKHALNALNFQITPAKSTRLRPISSFGQIPQELMSQLPASPPPGSAGAHPGGVPPPPMPPPPSSLKPAANDEEDYDME